MKITFAGGAYAGLAREAQSVQAAAVARFVLALPKRPSDIDSISVRIEAANWAVGRAAAPLTFEFSVRQLQSAK